MLPVVRCWIGNPSRSTASESASHRLSGWFCQSGAVAAIYDLETTEVRFEFSVEQLGEPSFFGGEHQKGVRAPQGKAGNEKNGQWWGVLFPDGLSEVIEYSRCDAFSTSRFELSVGSSSS